MKRSIPIVVCFLAGFSALAAEPQASSKSPQESKSSAAPSPRPAPCKPSSERETYPNGTMLWGTGRQVQDDETSSVLASLDLRRIQLGGTWLKGVRLEQGRLVAPRTAPKGLAGAMLEGTASDGTPVEVVLCDAEPAADDPSMEWYHIEIWDTARKSWMNPCIGTNQMPNPRVLAVRGVWNKQGSHQEVAGKFTMACETGAIAKCADWGYKPWVKQQGRSLQPLHQACTRMVRADYCGDGRNHTAEGTPIDVYDSMGVLEPTREASAAWDPRQASFEAAWAPDGAWCLSRTREGEEVTTALAQCPDRFAAAEKDLGEGDRCSVLRKGSSRAKALLRNHAYLQAD